MAVFAKLNPIRQAKTGKRGEETATDTGGEPLSLLRHVQDISLSCRTLRHRFAGPRISRLYRLIFARTEDILNQFNLALDYDFIAPPLFFRSSLDADCRLCPRGILVSRRYDVKENLPGNSSDHET